MKAGKENTPYLPKVAYVRLHTAGKTAKDYQQELKGQGFTFNQFKHMAKSDEYFDGLELWVSMWNYDNHENWHLWNWKKEDDNRVMLAMLLLLSWIVTNLLSYVVTNLSDKSACICQKYIFNRLIALFMRIPHGCQGRQRRLYSLDSHVEYAYTLAAIDKLESKEGHFTHNPVKVPKIPPLLRV